MQIQFVDLFTRSVIKKMTLRSKPKRPYNPTGGLEGYNVHFQNLESEADLRCSGPQCLLCGTKGEFAAFAQKAASMRFADLHLGLHTGHIEPAIKALIQSDNLSIPPSPSGR